MVSAVTLLKKCLSVNDSVIDNFKFFEDEYGVTYLHVYLHPLKSHSNRFQYVEKDVQSMTEALYTINGEVWMDLGGIIVELYSHTQRICCKEHGIKTASVPWAYPSSRFTKDFDMTATFLAMNINRKVASEYLRCDWHTIMRCLSRARSVLEPDIKETL